MKSVHRNFDRGRRPGGGDALSLVVRRQLVLERIDGKRARRGPRSGRARSVAAVVAAATALMAVSGTFGGAVEEQFAGAAPAGQGFTVSASDLQFILEQIQVSEHHAAQDLSADPCAGLRPDPNYVPGPLVPYGLRTVDGSCNNLQSGRENFGQSDQTFPRLTSTDLKPAQFGSSYAQNGGTVIDSEPRTVSNLIVDQTIKNPSALDAARFPIRSQDPNGLDVTPCTNDPQPGDPDGTPNGCTPSWETLFIPNVTTDVGLSPPYNSLFTIFGQFFDHGLDKINNGGNGTVITPLLDDDPFMAGPDRIFGTGDDLTGTQQIIVPLTRGSHNGDHQTVNSDSPFVDLSQAYTSHASHQVFLREYTLVAGKPVSTGKLLGIVGGPTDGAMANWDLVKAETATKLGFQLVDTDVNNIPMVLADPYGNYIPGPNGMPRFAATVNGNPVAGGIEGNLAIPVPFDGTVTCTGAGAPISSCTGTETLTYKAERINTAFLNDIAHAAGPGTTASPKAPDVDMAPEAPGPDGVLTDVPPTTAQQCTAANVPVGCNESLDDSAASGGPDGIQGDVAPTAVQPCTAPNNPVGCDESLENTPADPGPDGVLGDASPTAPQQCVAANDPVGCDESIDDVGTDPGPDGVLGDVPPTAAPICNSANNPVGCDESLDDTAASAGPDGVFLDVAPTGIQQCTGANIPAGCDESLDDVAASPGPDGVTGDAQPTAAPICTAPNNPVGCDESLDNIAAHEIHVAGGSLDQLPPGQYDDELLGLHVIAGDGRANENIGLTAIHNVFEREHNRLVADVMATLDKPENAALKAAYQTGGWGYGPRLFQAARFVTEMEYQHLVFEEFARKVQPLINPFTVYHDNVNSAITAEFAHAVYRFGHSMLDDTIPRINQNGSHNDIELFDGFLNPAAYADGGSSGVLTGGQSAGAIIMGLSDQVGNELDEFVAETLRNRLLGLPLDLATLNMTRARSEGIPRFNEVRRQIYATSGDSAMIPYTDWVDFGQNIKHPKSLVNFVAAYGQHPTIVGAATTAAKRDAAQAIVDPTQAQIDANLVPADASDFMFSTGFWSNHETGLNLVDLWIGGLAEKTNLFGGLLGSTFNYIFEKQMTDLQNGDRFYYLHRTPGMNLRAQLEGNSFAELVMRNTTAHSLKADSFATADCKFELADLQAASSGNQYFNGAGAVKDVDSNLPGKGYSECSENALLLQMSSGQWRYRITNPIDPPGINGQAVYNGTAGDDRVQGGADNDTFLGNEGRDWIEGGDGADVALGGDGNDIITDLAGDDVPKGGPGNDAIDAGPGLDIVMGGDGQDFTNGGTNDNETFGGNGDDFIIDGAGNGVVFGDSGSDWIEGGDGQELLCGESCAPFFDDPNAPGHDILIGQNGEEDYDAEGGDDILIADPGIERNAGAGGYDWSIHDRDPIAADSDLNIKLVVEPLPVNVLRDRYQEVEGLSGGALNDTLRGDDIVPVAAGGGGFTGCDALDQAGLNRIAGLDDIVPPLNTPIAVVNGNADVVGGLCPLTGPNVWGDGNIIVGGLGSDTLEGRGADDILDGDRYITVHLSIRQAVGSNTEIATTNLMETVPTGPGWTGNLAGKTLQQAVFAGLIDPAQIIPVRTLRTPVGGAADCGAADPANCDTAVFTGPRADYDIVVGAGIVTVAHTRGTAVDGIDTLRNVERLRFADQTVLLSAPLAPTNVTATAGIASASVSFTPSTAVLLSPVTSFTVTATTGSTSTLLTGVSPAATSVVFPGLTNGSSYTFTVAAVNAVGTGAQSAPSNAVTPVANPQLVVTPITPAAGATLVPVGANVTATFSRALAANGQVNATNVQLRRTSNNALVASAVTYAPATRTVTVNPTLDLIPGTQYALSFAAGSCPPTAAGLRSAAPCSPLAATSWSFTTDPAPVVTATTPAAGATGVARGANITATFSENVLGVSATTATVVRTSNGVLEPAVVTYNVATRTVTIDPVANLRRATQFTVTLTGGPAAIRSATAPNVPLVTRTFTFTTA